MLKFKKKDKPASGPKKEKRRSSSNPQGITASGNALYKVAGIGLGVLLLAFALGFGYLLLLREAGLQHQQVNRVANAYATQQATNVHRMIRQLSSRVESAARSPLALQAIASRSNDDVSLVEEAMLDYFPELASLEVIPVGDMGTAEFEGGVEGLRNHIEMDLVRRTSHGEKTLPEAYRFEERWITSVAQLVKHPRIEDRRAVIIASLDNDSITKQLQVLDTSVGRFALEQMYTSSTGTARTDVIATAGSGGAKEFTRYALIPESNWRVAFTPSVSLMKSLGINSLPVIGVLLLCIVASLGAFAIVVLRLPKVIDNDVNKMISAADRKSELTLAIPELVTVARQLRRATLRALRQANAGALMPEMAVEALGSSPVDRPPPTTGRQSNDNAVEVEEVLDLNLDEDILEVEEPDTAIVPTDGFPAHIFRAYDIRGNAAEELTDELVGDIGSAIGSIAGEMGEQALLIGCDGRSSSPRIKSALVRALMESGRDIIDIGLVPTPVLYFATRHLNCHSGVMITGSHNPAGHNGLKVVLKQETIAAGGISEIRDRALSGDFSKGNGRMIREDVTPAYIEAVLHDIAIAVPLKIVIDAGNGATSDIAPALFEELGCEVVPMYCTIDGNFPNHSPDTSDESNLRALVEAVQREEADFGVAFDGDGDRLAIVTSTGRIVRSDILLMIFAQDVVSRNPGADVVFDVKCSRNLTQLITRNGGRPILWKTGHAFMKQKMAETGALLGGEFSGHMFFGERWFGFDDGMYAAGRLAEILSTQGETLDEIIRVFPVTVNTPEILIPVAEQDKVPLMNKIIRSADFSTGKVNTMDGIRVDFAEGWGLLRASNTSSALTARFEAESEEALEMIRGEFRAQIGLVAPSLKVNF